MGLYSREIFPRLCDLVLRLPAVASCRRELLADVAGDVLEIGFGTGLNLPHYPRSVRAITAVDPHPGMHALARRRLRRTGIQVDHRSLRAEQLPFADASFDCVVSTFTLCSIAGVDQALGEVRRVLRPGGRFVFLEHGLSPDAGVRRWQLRLNRLEMLLADGCRLDRDIAALVGARDFDRLQLRTFYLRGVPCTHGFMYQGWARR